MGSRALAAMSAVALLIAACGSSGTSTASPTLGGGPVPGTSDVPPTAPPGSTALASQV